MARGGKILNIFDRQATQVAGRLAGLGAKRHFFHGPRDLSSPCRWLYSGGQYRSMIGGFIVWALVLSWVALFAVAQVGVAELALGVRAERLLDAPIISPESHPSVGQNIVGPSLIRAPSWFDEPLGRYYLYFADHKGGHIRLAYADQLTGPWSLYEGGTLQLEESGFLVAPPPATKEQVERVRALWEEVGVDTSALALDSALNSRIPT